MLSFLRMSLFCGCQFFIAESGVKFVGSCRDDVQTAITYGNQTNSKALRSSTHQHDTAFLQEIVVPFSSLAQFLSFSLVVFIQIIRPTSCSCPTSNKRQ